MKTNYSKGDIESFIESKLKHKVNLYSVTEGMESQVYGYSLDGKDYIIRINPDIEGFRKDDYACRYFNSENIPIPKVVDYGRFEGKNYYCISEKAGETTFEDLPEKTVEKLLPSIAKMMKAINDVDISGTNGYGVFDSRTGTAPFDSWKEYLLDILDDRRYNWKKVKALRFVDSELIDETARKFRELIPYCGNVRKLRHGDFGSNNVLIANDQITAIIDWDQAGYGDPLYEVASSHFWSPWLMCMDKSYQYFEKHYGDEVKNRKRILCYELHTGLSEIYECAADEDPENSEWIQNRCRELLRQDISQERLCSAGSPEVRLEEFGIPYSMKKAMPGDRLSGRVKRAEFVVFDNKNGR